MLMHDSIFVSSMPDEANCGHVSGVKNTTVVDVTEVAASLSTHTGGVVGKMWWRLALRISVGGGR